MLLGRVQRETIILVAPAVADAGGALDDERRDVHLAQPCRGVEAGLACPNFSIATPQLSSASSTTTEKAEGRGGEGRGRVGRRTDEDVRVRLDLRTALALELGARVIGVNNRNLHDFNVDDGLGSRPSGSLLPVRMPKLIL